MTAYSEHCEFIGSTLSLGFNGLGSDCQRLLDLRLAAKVDVASRRRRGDDGGFHFRRQRIVDVADLLRDDVRGLVVNETRLLK
jgi:hypothetical protein